MNARSWPLFLVAIAVGCANPAPIEDAGPTRDGGSIVDRDGGTVTDRDAGTVDAGETDAGVRDAGGTRDGGPDAGPATLMIGPRQGHSATLLNDGRVLVVGGFGSRTSETESWIFDPASNGLRPGPAITERNGHGAVRLPNGQVLITGGRSGQGAGATVLDTCMLFDPSTDTFSPTGNLDLVGGGPIFVIDSGPDAGRAIVFGRSQDGSEFLVDVYDPAMGTWSLKPNVSTPAKFGASIVKLSDGRILIAGGRDTALDWVDTAVVYDPAQEMFVAVGALPMPRSEMPAAELPDGRTLLVGGRDDMTLAIQTTVIFDPTTNMFSAGPNWPDATFLVPTVRLPDDRILFMNGNPDAIVYVYDPTTQMFSEHPRRMSKRLSLFTATLLGDGRVLAVGGQGNQGFIVGEAEIFTP